MKNVYILGNKRCEPMNQLQDFLNNTTMFSEEFKEKIISFTSQVMRDAYSLGIEDGKMGINRRR